MSGKARSTFGSILTIVGSFVPGWGWAVMAVGVALSYSGQRSQQREAQRRARAAANNVALRGNVRGTYEHHLMVFGKARVGGIIVAEGSLNGPNMPSEYFYLGIAHSVTHEGGCEGIEAVWIDDTRIPAADIDVNGEVTAGPFAGLVKLWHYRGTGTQAASSELTANNLDYSTAYRRGIQWTLARFTRSTDGDAFVNAFKGRFPTLTVEAKGIRCYDPRKDSTNGGSGAHRYSDPLTWEWTDNFILQAATFSIMNRMHGGEGIPPENIVWSTVAAAASVAEELITTPAGQQKRFTGSGVLDTKDKNAVNLQKLLDAGLGRRVEVGGMFEFHAASWRTPTFALDQTWLAGAVEIMPRGRVEGAYNYVRINYADKTLDYKTIEAPPYINAAYETEDGGERVPRDLNLPMVSDAYQAQYLSQILGKKSRDTYIIELAGLNLKGLDIKPWETGTITLPGFEADLAGKYFRVDSWEIGANGISAVLIQDKPENYTVDAFQAPVISDPPVLEIEGTSPPTNVMARAVADGIRLTWTPPYAHTFRTIEIHRSATSNGIFDKVGEVSSGTAYFVDGVTDGATWYYKLTARTSFGTYSGFSAVVSATAKLAADGSSSTAFNAGFESGDVDWQKEAGWTIVQGDAARRTGAWCAKVVGTGVSVTGSIRNARRVPAAEGDLVLATGFLRSSASANGTGRVRISWRDSADAEIGTSAGNSITVGTTYRQSRVSAAAPANTAYAAIEFQVVGFSSANTEAWYADDSALSAAPKTVDETPDGTTYGRPRLTALTSGEIDLSKAGVINRTADNLAESATRKWAAESGAQVVTGKSIDILADGATYGRTKLTALTAGEVDLSKAGVIGRNLGNIADDATYGRTKLTALTSGEVDLSKAGVLNRSADNLAESATRKWAAESGAQVVTGKSIDILADGATYGRTKLTAMTAGEVDLSKAGVIGRNLGNIADDATYGRTKLTALTSGEVDLSKAGVLNRTADNLAESATRKWAAESGAQVVTGKSLDILADGTTYKRVKATALTAGEVDMALAGVLNKTLTNIADGTDRFAGVQPAVTGDGFQILSNPDFAGGSTTGYSIYDNGASGSISLSAEADNTAPNSSGYRMKVAHTAAGAPTPGWGGFTRSVAVDGGAFEVNKYHRGSTILFRIRANIPVGYQINWASNSIGAGSSAVWLTSQAGTGAWKDYVIRVIIGTSGTFGVTGYFYLSGSTRPVDWYVAVCSAVCVSFPQGFGISDIDANRRPITDFASPHVNKNVDNVGDGTTYQRTKATALTSGEVDLSKAGVLNRNADNLAESATRKWAAESGAQVVTGKSIDILADGATYGRTKLTAMTAGEVDLSKAGVIGRNLGNIADDATYGRTKLTALTSGEVDLSKAGVLNRTADNLAESATRKWAAESGAQVVTGKSIDILADGATYGRTKLTAMTAGEVDLSKAGVIGRNLGNIADDATYGRTKLTALTSGEVDLSKAGVLNRNADNLAESATRKWAAESGAQVVTGKSIDILADGTTYKRVKATSLTAGEVDLSLAGVLNRNLDNVADSSSFKRVQTGTLAARPAAGTAGRFYLASDGGGAGKPVLYRDTGSAWEVASAASLANIIDASADNISESGSRKWAAESGAQVVTGKSIDILADGATYGRTKLTAMTAGEVDLSKAGVIGRNLGNIADDATYGRTKLTALTSGEVDLSKAGVLNRNADNLAESATRKWAAESGAEVTTGKSITVLADVATSARFYTFTQTITTTGAGSVTIPTGARSCIMRVWGGCGSGSKANPDANHGGGGGGGGSKKTVITKTTDWGGTISYNNGPGGAGVNTVGSGNAGTATTVTSSGLSFTNLNISANGGGAGTNSAGGGGGSASGGDTNTSGSAGTFGPASVGGNHASIDSIIPGKGGNGTDGGTSGAGSAGMVSFTWAG